MSVVCMNDVREALSFVDYNQREKWLFAAFAIKEEFGEEGFDVWYSWSQYYERFKHADALSAWKSAKQNGKTDIRWLFKEAISNGYKPKGYSDDEKREFAKEQAARRERVENERRIQADIEQALHSAVAAVADNIVKNHCKAVGNSPYLAKKKVGPSGALFPKCGMIAVVNSKLGTAALIVGKDRVADFFNTRDPKNDHISFLYIKPGCVIVPLYNDAGTVRNVQVIFIDKKRFIKGGQKSGLFCVLRDSLSGPVIIAEGFSTCASIAMAMTDDCSVVMAIDSGNLPHVARSICALYQGRVVLIAGDDDTETQENAGRAKALSAASECGCRVVFPLFSEVAA